MWHCLMCVCQLYLLDKIKDILSKGVVDNMTRMVLVNAIYFKGNWNKQFQESATRDAQFKLNKVTQHQILTCQAVQASIMQHLAKW